MHKYQALIIIGKCNHCDFLRDFELVTFFVWDKGNWRFEISDESRWQMITETNTADIISASTWSTWPSDWLQKSQESSFSVFSSLLSKDPSMLYDIRLKYTKSAVRPTDLPTFWNGAVRSAVPGYRDENVSESTWGIQQSQESRQVKSL